MGLFNLFKPTKTVLVVDGVALNDSLGMKGKIPPRNQLQTLRRLARFAQREKMEMVVVLSGTPLNKAPAKKKFEEILILYSNSAEEHDAFLAKTAKSYGSGAVIISDGEAAEKLVGNSLRKMRISTFRKAFEAGGEGEGSERGGRGEGGGRNRPPRRRQPRNNNNNEQQQHKNNEQQNTKNDRPEKKSSDSDAINELIDLVD